MPVLQIHVMHGQHPTPALQTLARQCSALFADTLGCPQARIRVLLHTHLPELCLVGGEPADQTPPAPFFSFYLLEGRPQACRDALLAGFTCLLADTLQVDAARVRGAALSVPPADWSIGGQAASAVRQQEILARQAAN